MQSIKDSYIYLATYTGIYTLVQVDPSKSPVRLGNSDSRSNSHTHFTQRQQKLNTSRFPVCSCSMLYFENKCELGGFSIRLNV